MRFVTHRWVRFVFDGRRARLRGGESETTSEAFAVTPQPVASVSRGLAVHTGLRRSLRRPAVWPRREELSTIATMVSETAHVENILQGSRRRRATLSCRGMSWLQPSTSWVCSQPLARSTQVGESRSCRRLRRSGPSRKLLEEASRGWRRPPWASSCTYRPPAPQIEYQDHRRGIHEKFGSSYKVGGARPVHGPVAWSFASITGISPASRRSARNSSLRFVNSMRVSRV